MVDWEQRKLGNLSEITDTKHATAPVVDSETPYKMIRTSAVRDGRLFPDRMDYVTYDTYEQWSERIHLKQNDVVISREAPMGEAAVIPTDNNKYFLGQRMVGIRVFDDLDPFFLLSTFLAPKFRKEIQIRNAESTTVANFGIPSIKGYEVDIPKKEEQTKIGSFFRQLDNTIALHQQKQRQIRSLKQGFIKNLFPNNKNSAPRIRFSIFNDDWNQRNASEIFTSVSDKNYPELPVLSASQEKGMVLRESNGIDIKYDQKSTGTYKRVLPGQFVMHLRSFQGGFAYSTIEGITSPAYTILAFRNKEDHYPLFWKSIFSSKNFIKRLEAITYGIRDGRSISYADFSTLRFWIPSYEEQKQIGDFIESIDATIAFYQRQIDMMQSLKKELLNKMFI